MSIACSSLESLLVTGVFFSFSSFYKLCSFGCVCLIIEAGLVILYLKNF